MTNKKGFLSCENKGFQITFDNGMTISVQWGVSNYCSRRSLDTISFNPELSEKRIHSEDAEIAIWDESGNWFDFSSDQVKPYCTPDEVVQIMNFVRGAKSFVDLREILVDFNLI